MFDGAGENIDHDRGDDGCPKILCSNCRTPPQYGG
jgi:hypothetical protein